MRILVHVLLLTILGLPSTVFAQRFELLDDGTVRDDKTNLVWLRDADCFGNVSWGNAAALVQSLSDGQCGLTDGSEAGDWVMPRIGQLRSLLDVENPPDRRFEMPNISNAAGDARWSEGNAFFRIRTASPGPPNLYWSSSIDPCGQTGARVLSPYQGFSLGCLPRDSVEATIWPVRKTGNFAVTIATKMYIGPIATDECDPVAVVGTDPLLQALYMVFCLATDDFFSENPQTGDTTVPLDARVLSVIRFDWFCQSDSNFPVVAEVESMGSFGGPEPGGLTGTANAVAIEETITQNGQWAFVSSGRPHPIAELAFQLYRARNNMDIWHRVEGSISCGVDSNGEFESTIDFRFSDATRFPSHRSFLEPEYGSLGTSTGGETRIQEAFSNLWFLQPVPPP